MALAHSAWILIHRETSDAWDAPDELLALVWNSEPHRGAPKNTSGGINDRRTLSARVGIRVVDPLPGEATEVVQLVATSQVADSKRLDVNVEYGAKS